MNPIHRLFPEDHSPDLALIREAFQAGSVVPLEESLTGKDAGPKGDETEVRNRDSSGDLI